MNFFKGDVEPCDDSATNSANLGKPWLDLQFHDRTSLVKMPNELEKEMRKPRDLVDASILERVRGSMIGMALGDALGAHVEFRPREYLVNQPVTKLEGGGTWGLKAGQVRLNFYKLLLY